MAVAFAFSRYVHTLCQEHIFEQSLFWLDLCENLSSLCLFNKPGIIYPDNLSGLCQGYLQMFITREPIFSHLSVLNTTYMYVYGIYRQIGTKLELDIF